MDAEVLVVGAGPTGLMLANQLGRRGVEVMLIDRHAGPAIETRAMAVHARSLEMYAKLGIAERAIALGRPVDGVNLWAEGQWRARIPLGAIGEKLSPFPFVLMLGQDDNERLLGERLGDWGIAVRWSTELVALEQDSSGVAATLKLPDGGRQTIRAAYIAGCDGGRSAVRELNGIGFPGAPYEHVFFVADTEATGPMVPEELNVYLWRDGLYLFFPMRGTDRWRVIGILPERLRDTEKPTFEALIPAIRAESGAAVSFKSCSWLSTYRIHHRCAERFAAGRCFLLGDAAHVHSPAGGQGMNTGLQDAYNLAWKLALVVDERADPALLATYEAERVKVARRLLETTDRAFRLVVSDHRMAAVFRTRIVARIAALAIRAPRIRRLAFRTLSQIGIRYRESPLSRTLPDVPRGAPRAGDRFPWLRLAFGVGREAEDLFERLDDTRLNLLVIGQPAPAAGSFDDDLLDVHAPATDPRNDAELARVGIAGAAFYLLRPDGHVGLAGARLDLPAVTRWLADAGIHGAADGTKRRGIAADAALGTR